MSELRALGRLEVGHRLGGPWVAVAATASLAVFALVVVNGWRYTVDRGVAVGGLATDAVVAGAGVVLVVLLVEAGTAVPRARSSGLLRWLATTPAGAGRMVTAIAAGSLAVAGLAVLLVVPAAAVVSATVGAPVLAELAVVAPAFLASCLHVVGLGLLVGSWAASTRGALAGVLALLVVSGAVVVLETWLAARPTGGAYDPAGVVAVLADAVRAPADVLLPGPAFLRGVELAGSPAGWVQAAVVAGQGVLALVLTSRTVLRPGGLL